MVRAGSNIFGEPACVLLRRDLLELTGWWSDTYPYLLDEATYANLLFHGDVVAIRETLASFRLSATQWSVGLTKVQANQAANFHGNLRTSRTQAFCHAEMYLSGTRRHESMPSDADSSTSALANAWAFEGTFGEPQPQE